MAEKINFYKDGNLWIFRNMVTPPNVLMMKELVNNRVVIKDRARRVRYQGKIENILNKEGEPYADYDALLEATEGFFDDFNEPAEVQLGIDRESGSETKVLSEKGTMVPLPESMIEIEYANLVQLRDNSELVPGMYYRITDYETTTVQDETQSAGHPFDVVVLALAVDKLSENAFATHSERDTEGYFADSKLEAWKLKYSLDNDIERFQWADDVNGKGVIYQMIDEWNNDLPYDFKNIMFKRYKIESTQSGKEDILNIVGKYNAAKENNLSTVYVVDEDDFEWFYTFSVFFMNDTENVVDVSTKQDYVYSDEGFCYKTKNNIFGNSKTGFWDETLEKTFLKFFLGNNVIVHHSEENEGSTYVEFYGFYNNTVGNDFRNNTVGNDFRNNTVGNDFYRNTVGNSFRLNHVKDGLVGTNNSKKDWTVSEASVLYDKHYSATIYGYREASNVATTNTIIYYDGAGEQVKVTF